MSSPAIQERLDRLGLDAEALELLRELEPLFEEHAEEIVEQFWSHLLAHDETRALFRDPEMKARLFDSRRRYIVSLALGDFDADYLETRRRSGELHEQAGLGPSWITRLSQLHLRLMAPILERHFAHDPAKGLRALLAIAARFALDVEITMESFIERQEAGMAFMAQELARERRKLEQDLRDQGARLRVTAERAQAAEELASIATLVAGLAHEIGTPMGVIQGHAKMLERYVEGDEDGSWRLHTIQEQIARISKIIHTLLKIARPKHMERERVDLGKVLDQTLSFVSEKLSRRRIAVEASLPPGVVVVGDAERLQQLFLNLFLNAADAMPEGGALRVALASRSGRVRVEVTDSGVGIDPEDCERIFEPFFSTKEAGQGNGLGLMVCRGIVTDHGGQIAVDSEPGQGATFAITLPRAPDPAAAGG